MIPIPNRHNEFLAIMDFYLKATPSLAKLVWVKYSAELGFEQHDLFYLPYLHRFDLYATPTAVYLLGCTIAEAKDHKDDWTRPGMVYGAILPDDLTQPIALTALKGGLFKNHGYCRSKTHSGGFIACDDGVYQVTTPSVDNDQWKIEKIFDGAMSEVAFADIDNDGQDEMISIEPFHGNSIKIYKKLNHQYQPIYQYPFELDFAHTIIGTKLFTKQCFIGGIRRINPDLFMISMQDNQLITDIIDQGCGPANCNVYDAGDTIYLHSANHTANHAAIYLIKE